MIWSVELWIDADGSRAFDQGPEKEGIAGQLVAFVPDNGAKNFGTRIAGDEVVDYQHCVFNCGGSVG